VAWSLFHRIFYELALSGWCSGFRKNRLPSHPTFTPDVAGEDTSTSTTEIGGASRGWDSDDRGNFPWKDCEKMESRVMIIEETFFVFLGVLFQAPQN